MHICKHLCISSYELSNYAGSYAIKITCCLRENFLTLSIVNESKPLSL